MVFEEGIVSAVDGAITGAEGSSRRENCRGALRPARGPTPHVFGFGPFQLTTHRRSLSLAGAATKTPSGNRVLKSGVSYFCNPNLSANATLPFVGARVVVTLRGGHGEAETGRDSLPFRRG